MAEASVYNSHGHVVGTIKQPCCPGYLCKYELEIYKGLDTNQGSLFRKIKACALNGHSCCSVGFCGMCCNELDFEFVDGMGHHKGMFKKIHNGCVNECFTGADRYDITISDDEVDAALVLAAL